MREILFRGQRKDTKEWEYGDLRHGGYVHNDSETYIMRSDYALHNIPVDPETIGQFTGLYDNTKWEKLTKEEKSDWLKNHTVDEWKGRKIFEGDIVQSVELELKGIIVFDEHCRFMIKDLTTGSTYLISYNCDEIKVIGTIHDNPELLVESENFKNE